MTPGHRWQAPVPALWRCLAPALIAVVCGGCVPTDAGSPGGGGSYEILLVRDGALYAMRPDGTMIRPIAAWLSGCREPQGSPDGRHIAVCTGRFIYMLDRDGSDAHAVAGPVPESGPVFPNWAADGRHLAFTGDDLKPHVVDLDAEMRSANERQYGRATGLWPGTPSYYGPTQTLLFADFSLSALAEPVTVAEDGTGLAPVFWTQPSPIGIGSSRRPAISPDGQTMLFENDARGGYDIYLADLLQGEICCLTEADAPLAEGDDGPWDRNTCPRFTPDQRAIYESTRPLGDSAEHVAQIWVHNLAFGERPLTSSTVASHTPGILVAVR